MHDGDAQTLTPPAAHEAVPGDTGAGADDMDPRGNHQLTAIQLRRLGEAVDGDRRGGNVYVVMRISGEPPFDVARVTEDEALARAIASNMSTHGRRYRVFGPYQSERDRGGLNRRRVNQLALTLCHEPDSDDCDESKVAWAGGFPKMSDITRATLVMSLNSGAQYVVECGAPVHRAGVDEENENAPADAVFIGMSAIDKFWIPYLQRVYGTEVADKRRRELTERLKAEMPEATA